MKRKDLVIAGLAALILGVAAAVWLAPGLLQPQAPEVRFHGTDGRTLTLAELRGRPVLVNFWATTCPGCIKEMPELVKLYRELGPKGLEVIGVAMPYDKPSDVIALQKKRELPYFIALDPRGEVVAAFGGVRLTPTSYLIDPEGRIVFKKIGEPDWQRLRKELAPMLKG
ncbi:MAG: TlpA family protein disulfide reductase [Gammaproteobacteria bacterium]|nr:MAG: TlpA family protein disulfide reductase [Gammaproteobacteria bacterium]